MVQGRLGALQSSPTMGQAMPKQARSGRLPASSKNRCTIGREPRVVGARIPALVHEPGGAALQLDRGEPRVGAAHVAREHITLRTLPAVSLAAAARSRNQSPRRASWAGTSFGASGPSTARATTAALSAPGRDHGHPSRRLDHRRRDGHPVGGGLGPDHRHDQPAPLVQRVRARKQRRRVPVRADAEDQDVERGRQQLLVVARGGVPVGALGLHAVDLRGGDRHPGEQGRAHHPVVAVGVVRRHRALVAEEHVHPGPVDRRRPRQLPVHRLGRPPARQRDRARAPPADGRRHLGRQPLGRRPGEVRRLRHHRQPRHVPLRATWGSDWRTWARMVWPHSGQTFARECRSMYSRTVRTYSAWLQVSGETERGSPV